MNNDLMRQLADRTEERNLAHAELEDCRQKIEKLNATIKDLNASLASMSSRCDAMLMRKTEAARDKYRAETENHKLQALVHEAADSIALLVGIASVVKVVRESGTPANQAWNNAQQLLKRLRPPAGEQSGEAGR